MFKEALPTGEVGEMLMKIYFLWSADVEAREGLH